MEESVGNLGNAYEVVSRYMRPKEEEWGWWFSSTFFLLIQTVNSEATLYITVPY